MASPALKWRLIRATHHIDEVLVGDDVRVAATGAPVGAPGGQLRPAVLVNGGHQHGVHQRLPELGPRDLPKPLVVKLGIKHGQTGDVTWSNWGINMVKLGIKHGQTGD